MRWRVVKQIAATSFREFIRTPEAVFWTYGFPLIAAIALGLAFSSEKKEPLPIVVADLPAIAKTLKGEERLDVHEAAAEVAEADFKRSRYVALLRKGEDDKPALVVDPTRPESELAQMLVSRALTPGTGRIEAVQVVHERTPGSRYIDWLIPGLIGLNLLGAGMWGIGFNLVQLRAKNTMRRLMVTPMTRLEFLFSYMLSRLFLVIPDSAVVLAFGHFVFDVPINGSFWLLLLLVLLGGATFMGMGILIASRARTVEAVSGLMNLVMLPMWLLAGTFFSSERFPDVMQPLVKALPLTHLNNALRAVVLEGQGFMEIAMEVGILAGFCVVCFALAIRMFRWY